MVYTPKEYIGHELHFILVVDFPTITSISKVASEIVLLYSKKKYFNYVLMTFCGIKGFLVEGNVKNTYKNIGTHEIGRRRMGENYIILQKIIESLTDEIVIKFWNCFYT